MASTWLGGGGAGGATGKNRVAKITSLRFVVLGAAGEPDRGCTGRRRFLFIERLLSSKHVTSWSSVWATPTSAYKVVHSFIQHLPSMAEITHCVRSWLDLNFHQNVTRLNPSFWRVDELTVFVLISSISTAFTGGRCIQRTALSAWVYVSQYLKACRCLLYCLQFRQRLVMHTSIVKWFAMLVILGAYSFIPFFTSGAILISNNPNI